MINAAPPTMSEGASVRQYFDIEAQEHVTYWKGIVPLQYSECLAVVG